MVAVHRAPFLCLAPRTTLYQTFLFRCCWALLVSFLFGMMPISPTYVRFMTARFGLLKQSQAFFIGIRGTSCSTGSSTDAGPGPRVADGQLDSDPSSEIAPHPRCSSSQWKVQPVFPGPVSPQPVF